MGTSTTLELSSPQFSFTSELHNNAPLFWQQEQSLPFFYIKMSSSGDELSWGCLEQTVEKGLLPWDITVQVWFLIFKVSFLYKSILNGFVIFESLRYLYFPPIWKYIGEQFYVITYKCRKYGQLKWPFTKIVIDFMLKARPKSCHS